MDTRTKIVAFDHACSLLSEGWAVVLGVFDPLTLEQGSRLEQVALKGKVLVVVDPAEHCLLSAEARAKLVAALRSVDAVCIADLARARSFCAEIPGLFVDDDRAAENKRTSDFMEFVRGRQKLSEVAQ
jgi:hypothetical protein